MMQIPSILFGSYREVKLCCRKLIKQLVKGASWQEIFSSCDMLDTCKNIDIHNNTGLLVLNGPNSTINAYGPQFHVYVLHDELIQASWKKGIPKIIEEKVFEASLATDWGTLGLLARKNTTWFYRPELLFSEEEWQLKRFEPMLDACLQHWGVLYAEGSRYTNGSSTPQDLWTLNTSLGYILANMNVPREVFISPLPSGGLSEVIAFARSQKSL